MAEGSGNLALVIFHRVELWPENVEDLRRVIVGNGNISARQYGHFLGVILHEICHTFDLLHSPFGIMNRDFTHILDLFGYLSEGNCRESADVPSHLFGNSIFSAAEMAVLSNHAWMNDYANDEMPTLEICENYINLSPKHPKAYLLLVQICLDDRVVKHIDIESPSSRFSLRREDISSFDLGGQPDISLLIMDSYGNVYKRKMSVYDVYISVG